MQRLSTAHKKQLRVNRGQIRMFEAVVATIIIFVAFSASVFLMSPSRLWQVYEKEYLDRLGYNILHNLAETRAIESVLRANNPGIIKSRLEMIIKGIVPLLTYYNLTILKCATFEDGSFGLQRLISISNASPEVFGQMPEVSSTMMVYTTSNRETYYLVLVLAKGSEKA